MEPCPLQTCEILAGPPVLVGQTPGHFWFPSLHALGMDCLFCEANLADDRAQGRWPAVLVRSQDAGQNWVRSVEPTTYGPCSTIYAPDRLLLMPYETWPLSLGEKRGARADGTLITCGLDGGLSAEAAPVQYLGFPFDLEDYFQGELMLLNNGNILSFSGGRRFTTLYGRIAGEAKDSVFAMASEDGGLTWHFQAVVASGKDIHGANEGANESNTVRLVDGRLMCVFRTGSGQDLHKSYSIDEGGAWTKPERMPGVWSVEPQLARLENGLIVLSSGRPGLFLWVCSDGEENGWERFNLAAHHNAAFPDRSQHYTDAFCQADPQVSPALSTSYTGILAMGPHEVFVCYDRLGNGWGGAPGPWGGTDAIFCVRLQITRKI